jgi:hypothetical protein
VLGHAVRHAGIAIRDNWHPGQQRLHCRV